MTTGPSDLHRLIEVVQVLRSPGGCPWDQKQTTKSLKKYLSEEFQEILTAIDNDDHANLCEELGDVLYLLVMISEINRQQDHFTFEDVMTSITEKLIRRHPHVFSEKQNLDEETLRKQWLKIKDQEKFGKK